MKLTTKSIQLSVSLAALFFAQSSFAAAVDDAFTVPGTTAGTEILNTATLSYSIGDAVQTPITSDVAKFVVDKKVDLTVTGDQSGTIKVVPSSERATAENKLTYVLSNEGNAVQHFKIALSHIAHPTDDFDAGTTITPGTTTTTTAPQAAEACQFTINDGTTTTGPHAITETPIVMLAIEGKATIAVTCSMPNSPDVVDGHKSTLDVLATAVVDGTVGAAAMSESGAADNKDLVDVVLADDDGTATDKAIAGVAGAAAGERNASHSATQTYEIDVPMLSVVKTSKVISDPYNGDVSPKRIPGAIVEYTIAISNSSDSAATGVKIADLIQGAGVTVEFVGPIVNDNGTAADYGTTTAKTVTATGITVPAASGAVNGKAEVTFTVKIL